jgi:hypothetical protein
MNCTILPLFPDNFPDILKISALARSQVIDLERRNNLEERFDLWLAENYPDRNINYLKLIGKTPQEFYSILFIRLMRQIDALRKSINSQVSE